MTPEQRVMVCAEARTWLGTKYHHHGRVKGAGVDCAQILCAVYEACGVVPHIDPGWYARDWHMHRSEEVYAQWMALYCNPLPCREALLPGDAVLFRFGRCYSHGAILLEDGNLIHSYIGRGVVLSTFNEEPLQGRESTYWTLK